MDPQELAAAIAKEFERTTRASTGQTITVARTERASELAQRVHQDLDMHLPDDWTYDAIAAALEALADGEDPGEWYPPVAVSIRDLLHWLQECPVACWYADQEVAEGHTGLFDLLTAAQGRMYLDVMASVCRHLWEMREQIEADAEAEAEAEAAE